MPSNSATEKTRPRLRSRAVTGTPLELRVVFWLIIAIFAVFLVAPLVLLLIKSFNVDGSFSLASYAAVLSLSLIHIFLRSLRHQRLRLTGNAG